MTPCKITAIIPFKCDGARQDLLDRVERLANQCQTNGMQVVLVQELTEAERPTTRFNGESPYCKLVSYSDNGENFSLSKARNFGLSFVTTEWLITLDADLILPPTFGLSLNALLETQLFERETFFLTLPVIYAGENVNLSNLLKIQNFGEAVFGGTDIEHWALGSSVIIVRSAYLRKLGGYHEAYLGWGYEDHDMAMQLVSRDNTFLTAYDSRVFDPRPMQNVTRYVGWRAKYALYGRLALNFGLFLLHQYHPKNTRFAFNELVKENETTFRRRLAKIEFPIFRLVVFGKDSTLYSQYHLYFEQLHLGRVMAAIKNFMLRSRFIIKVYRKLRGLG